MHLIISAMQVLEIFKLGFGSSK